MPRLRPGPSVPPDSQHLTRPSRRMTRTALKEKTNVTRVPRYPNDGNTENLVKDARSSRGRPSQDEEYNRDEFLMAGAIGGLQSHSVTSPKIKGIETTNKAKGIRSAGTKRPGVRRGRSRRVTTEDEKSAEDMSAGGENIHDKSDLIANIHHTASPTTTSPLIPPQVEMPVSVVSIDEIERAPSSSNSTPSPRAATVPLSLETSSRDPISIAPGSVFRNPGTPAIESSILLRNFKRRPRQPSMLAMVQHHQQLLNIGTPRMASGSVVDDTSNFGDGDLTFDIEAGLESDSDMDQFAPEAEGTPLHATIQKTLRGVRDGLQRKPSIDLIRTGDTSRKRKSNDLEVGSGRSCALDALHAKRRKSQTWQKNTAGTSSQLPQTDEVPRPLLRLPAQNPVNKQHPPEDIQVVHSSPIMSSPASIGSRWSASRAVLDTTEATIPSTEPQDEPGTAELPSSGVLAMNDRRHTSIEDTMADPTSSSPSRTLREQEAIMAYPLTQPSQQTPRVTRRHAPKAPGTAKLQRMLPQRRQRLFSNHEKSEYDLNSSDLSDLEHAISLSESDYEVDELESRPKRTTVSKRLDSSRKQTTKDRASSRSAKARKDEFASSSRRKRTTTGKVRKSSSKVAAQRIGSHVKTYGRSTANDKENDELYQSDSEAEAEDSVLPDATISFIEAAKSKELEDAKKKFAEIDAWDGLEYESLDGDNRRSSSQDWR